MRKTLITGLLAITFSVNAQDCFEMAGRDYRIEPDLLRAISFRESSWRDNALNVVSQSEYAVGKMQIHSQNFSHLAQFGITPQQLYTDSCLNIYTGAYYLAIAFKRWGYSWRAVGAIMQDFVKRKYRRKSASNMQKKFRQFMSPSKKMRHQSDAPLLIDSPPYQSTFRMLNKTDIILQGILTGDKIFTDFRIFSPHIGCLPGQPVHYHQRCNNSGSIGTDL